MKVVAAYLLAVLGGNNSPSVDDINTILASVGIEAENEKIELLLSQVKDKDLTELIACGREKMASLPTSGGGVAAAVGAVAPTYADPAPVATEVKKEEEDDEGSDEDMSLLLFDF